MFGSQLHFLEKFNNTSSFLIKLTIDELLFGIWKQEIGVIILLSVVIIAKCFKNYLQKTWLDVVDDVW